MNIPILFTCLRILLIPGIVLFYYLPFNCGHLIATLIFLLAAITDWADGYLARTLGQTTKLGAFLDPVADKLVVAVALVIIVGDIHGALIAIPAAIIVAREIVISALREWMAEIGKRISVAVGEIGKIKTAMQMVALIILLLYRPGHINEKWLEFIGIGFLYVAVGLTLWSMFVYLKTAWPDLTLAVKKQ